MKAIKSNRKSARLLIIGIFLLLRAATTFASVHVDFDENIDFSKYRTYSFTEGTPTPESLTNQRIEKAIESQLAAKGLTRVESGGDLTVLYHCSINLKTQLNTNYLGGWGWGPGWRRGWGRGWRGWGGLDGDAITTIEEIPQGTLIVDIGDSATKKYIWRGTATRTVSSKPDKNARAIADVVKKMFEKFPPERKK